MSRFGASHGSVTYTLIDFGEGRKLESIGDFLVDRPSPAASGAVRRQTALWSNADARFEDGRWSFSRPWPEDLAVDCGEFAMPVSPTPFGHLGLFPEQAPNWTWIQEFCGQVKSRACAASKTLNLFAYTGASTLAAAAKGEVTHVDAAKPNVEAAKRAARMNGLAEATIRYVVDDARKYVAREIRRARKYDLIVLDPPAYGHGSKGKAWRIDRDLWPLLEACFQLVDHNFGAILLSGHTAGFGPGEIRRWARDQRIREMVSSGYCEQAGQLGLDDANGRILDAGFYLRMSWGREK